MFLEKHAITEFPADHRFRRHMNGAKRFPELAAHGFACHLIGELLRDRHHVAFSISDSTDNSTRSIDSQHLHCVRLHSMWRVTCRDIPGNFYGMRTDLSLWCSS